MYGLAKVAGFREDVMERFEKYRAEEREKLKHREISDEEVENLVNHLKEDYGVDAPFKKVDNLYQAKANAESGAKFYDRLEKRFIPDFERMESDHVTNRGYESPPYKESILHEAGHILDPKLTLSRLAIENGLRQGGGAGALGAAIAPSVVKKNGGDTKDQATAAGISAGAGLGSNMLFHHMQGVDEDRANEFAKRYMTDELGDAEKAQQWIDESIIPEARNSYRFAAKAGGAGIGLAGLAAGGIGMGIAHHVHNKSEQQGK